MPDEVTEQHQLAGLDERERGFNRLVELIQRTGEYRAMLRYEATLVVAGDRDTAAAALNELIHLLHARGYTQLRSRLTFSGNAYLGSREPWVEYPDPAQPSIFRSVLEWWRRVTRVMGG